MPENLDVKFVNVCLAFKAFLRLKRSHATTCRPKNLSIFCAYRWPCASLPIWHFCANISSQHSTEGTLWKMLSNTRCPPPNKATNTSLDEITSLVNCKNQSIYSLPTSYCLDLVRCTDYTFDVVFKVSQIGTHISNLPCKPNKMMQICMLMSLSF